jgi:hypothetical protein
VGQGLLLILPKVPPLRHSASEHTGTELAPIRPEPQHAWGTNLRGAADFEGLLRRYYRNGAIRRRMYEFLGGSNPQNATAAYIVGDDGRADFSAAALPARLPDFLEAGLEVERSLWDRKLLIADIDLEYDNFDCPAAPWLDPQRTFGLQEPVVEAALQVLGQAGLAPLVLVSGRGFHLVWAIDRNSSAFHRLARLGHVPPSLEARYARARSPAGVTVDRDLGRAYAGLGMVLEFAGHRVLAASAANCAVPVQITSIEVGPGIRGREIVSFDLSEYGDPLDTRHIRLPFSVYLKPRRLEWALGEEGARALLPIFEIPLSGLPPPRAIELSRDPDRVLELARRFPAHIPDRSEPMERLLDEYESSALAAFHLEFYSDPWDRGPDHAIAPSLSGLPPCVTWLLDHPNDWLLKPAAVQHIARVLTAIGWCPRAIAQLIYSRYARDCGWGRAWERLDPFNRAVFYTRLFTGMIATGIDKLIDLNCVSHREKGYCTVPECRSNLVPYRNMLQERRSH